MSNVETEPVELKCGARTDAGEPTDTASRVDVLAARDVPLGGPRAMRVRRTLPQRARTLIGAWCFADHYGPVEVATGHSMDVAPHPHTGLQTVSWLFSGEIEHRDSLGTHALIRPGEMNLMTGGHGIAHSEVSTPATTVLHGVQLWVALPGEHRSTERDFQHHVPEPVRVDGAEIRVFLGELAGIVSPVRTFTPSSAPRSSSNRVRRSASPWTPPSNTASSSTVATSGCPAPCCARPNWATCRPAPLP